MSLREEQDLILTYETDWLDDTDKEEGERYGRVEDGSGKSIEDWGKKICQHNPPWLDGWTYRKHWRSETVQMRMRCSSTSKSSESSLIRETDDCWTRLTSSRAESDPVASVPEPS